jgi:type VI protein secretion system component Hcp
MKMKTFILISVFFLTQVAAAQVGIGTTTPGTNSVLDLESNDKGLLLPRLNDTSNVGTPTEGLMIYNRNTKSPSIHNGTSWNTLALNPAMTSGGDKDSVTYSIDGPGSGNYATGEFNVLSLSEGGAAVGSMLSWTDLNFSKLNDANSIPLLKALVTGTVVGDIEFMIYESGAATPYYSVKLTAWKVTSVSFSMSSTVEDGKIESISLQGEVIGFKDWLTDDSFSYNLQSGTIGMY